MIFNHDVKKLKKSFSNFNSFHEATEELKKRIAAARGRIELWWLQEREG